MENDLTRYIRSAEKIQRKMASSPCQYIELAFEAERHALEASGGSRDALRKAIQTTSAPEKWTDTQRTAFIAWVEFLEGRLEDR